MEKRITRIENGIQTEKILRVAAYCRVSTDYDDQLQSLTAQRSHYEKFINSNPKWSFAGIYYDEGISGTKKEKRPALMQLISDCENGKIDLVITKSISRFARNTTDCLELVRKLSSLGISIIFEKEKIDTGSMEGELILTILSSLAEQESVSISTNCKWSVKKRYEEGRFTVAYPPYGYRNIDGEMLIDETEAQVVRNIFSSYLAGKSAYIIAKELSAKGVPTRKGGKWHSNSVIEILKNEKYTGDVIYQKTWTDSGFNRHINHGEVDSYYVSEHHEPIISFEAFEAANALIESHMAEKGIERNTQKYEKRYVFSGRIICGNCGRTFKRRICKRGGERYISWACGNHIDGKELCPMKAVTQDQIETAFTTMMNKLIFASDKMLKPYMTSLSGTDRSEIASRLYELEELIGTNEKERERLMDFLRRCLISKDLINTENNSLLKEYIKMCDERDSLRSLLKADESYVKAAGELIRYTEKHDIGTEFDEDAFLRFVDHAEVYSQHDITFCLHCGLRLREKM